MQKTISKIIAASILFILLSMSACTQNNGNIGIWFANFEDCGDHIIITFPYVTDENGNPVYDENGDLLTEDRFFPLEITRMSMGENILNVDQANGDKLQLSMIDAAGETVVFRLKKWK